MDAIITGGRPGLEGNNQHVGETFNAAMVALRPLDYDHLGEILGHYRVCSISGNVAAAGANGPIHSLRWDEKASFFVLMSLQVSAVVAAAVTAQVVDFDAIVARKFSVADSGGTAIDLSGSNNALRKIMGESRLADMRVAAAVALTAGTRTLDAQPFAGTALGIGSPGMTTIGAATPLIPVYKWDGLGQHPIVLSKNEGIVCRTPTSVATGSIKYYLTHDWAEVKLF